MSITDPSLNFHINYRSLIREGGSVILVNVSDTFDYDGLFEMLPELPKHHLIMIGEEGFAPTLRHPERVAKDLLSLQIQWLLKPTDPLPSLMFNAEHLCFPGGDQFFSIDLDGQALLDEVERRCLEGLLEDIRFESPAK
ncbi:MAG: hypothetical protein RLZZ599_624 [Bacteroidota bacterium]